MKITTEKIKGSDLKPGELFSSAGDEYWQHRDNRSIGEKVYIRTDTPLLPSAQEEVVYRIVIKEDGHSQAKSWLPLKGGIDG